MPPRRLCLLDRNAVDRIKDSNASKAQTDKKKLALLQRLRALDQPGICISPMLSVIEGEHGRPDTPEEKEACARKEAEAAATFYKKARIDTEFLQASAATLGQIFAQNREVLWPTRERFLEFSLPLLATNVKQEKRAKLEKQLLQKAEELGVPLGDPAVMLTLATLYGGRAARKVLHPHKINIYNTLNDIQVISRVGYIMALLKQNGSTIPVSFVTGDEGLDEVVRGVFRIDHTASGSDGHVLHEMQYSTAWFGDLKEEDAIELMRRVYDRSGASDTDHSAYTATDEGGASAAPSS
ncbi:hypothetical protein [Comamonas testosteroni]|jgi:hypothetical protein|uniref:hypothetical protein n=1 Tax=Comamonas testosteroni TaxID=285 RepID=UPI0026EEA6F5|nr:hypothetical protein [Comamonas testosteroni]